MQSVAEGKLWLAYRLQIQDGMDALFRFDLQCHIISLSQVVAIFSPVIECQPGNFRFIF
jgi:hypothetical protein